MRNINLETIMPLPLAKTVSLFAVRYPNVSMKIIINILLVKMAQMFTAKRIMYIEFDKEGIPNHYTIVFMPSGYGKDKLSDEMDKYIFSDFRLWFRDKVKTYRVEQEEAIKLLSEKKFPGEKYEAKREKFIAEETLKIRDLSIEIHSGTAEGFFADAKAFSKVDFGSLFVKLSELGMSLKNARPEELQFIQQLLDAYSGRVYGKCIKSENRESDIDMLPCCILLYSDPTLFANEIKEMFDTLMRTGLGRRATISYLPDGKIHIEEDIDKAYERDKYFPIAAKREGQELFNIFYKVPVGAKYELSENTFKQVFHPYKNNLTKRANDLEDNLLKKEILSRELKALKLSCLFAVINHPTEYIINPDDMKQAIAVVDMLGEDFKLFTKLKPERKDRYERVFEFFKENLGQEFTMTDLKRKHWKKFGVGRKAFNKEFEEIMTYVSDIAAEKGYMFNITDMIPIGKKYGLTEIPSGQLNKNIIPLGKAINQSATTS